MTAINRPLTAEERDLLANLATRTLAEQIGCADDEARDALENHAALGHVVLKADDEDADIYLCGKLLVETKRDWLAFHAAHPGNDPMGDARRSWVDG